MPLTYVKVNLKDVPVPLGHGVLHPPNVAVHQKVKTLPLLRVIMHHGRQADQFVLEAKAPQSLLKGAGWGEQAAGSGGGGREGSNRQQVRVGPSSREAKQAAWEGELPYHVLSDKLHDGQGPFVCPLHVLTTPSRVYSMKVRAR